MAENYEHYTRIGMFFVYSIYFIFSIIIIDDAALHSKLSI